jgi:tRNA-splicing ligase RtcB
MSVRKGKTMPYELLESEGARPIKMWTHGVPVEELATQQLVQLAHMPFIFSHVAVMPDVHYGCGSTIGSVFACKGAVIPAAVGVDIGCGMHAERTQFTKSDLPDLPSLRAAIESRVPAGRTCDGRTGDVGAWAEIPEVVQNIWDEWLSDRFAAIVAVHKKIGEGNLVNHLGTLGTGNHFIEVCLDANDRVWFLLHSGSRGVGNRIGSYFIALAKKACDATGVGLPNRDLAYITEDSEDYLSYIEAMSWAQDFALINRQLMMQAVRAAWTAVHGTEPEIAESVNTHHNYAAVEEHFGERVLLTRKGAVRAQAGDWCIIPGSMGARSYVGRGLGNPDSFMSCSHGAGRAMSRTQAKKTITLEQHAASTAGVECDKGEGTLDESPSAYKSIDAVLAAESDLVQPVYVLKQVLCVKGLEDPNKRKRGK